MGIVKYEVKRSECNEIDTCETVYHDPITGRIYCGTCIAIEHDLDDRRMIITNTIEYADDD